MARFEQTAEQRRRTFAEAGASPQASSGVLVNGQTPRKEENVTQDPFASERARIIAGQAGGAPKAISIDGLNKDSSAPFDVSRQPSQPDFKSLIAGIPDQSEFIKNLQKQTEDVQKVQEERSGLKERLLQSFGMAQERETEQKRLEQERGLPVLQTELDRLNREILAIKAETEAIPDDIQTEFEGRGVTAGGVRPQEMARLRRNATRSRELFTRSLALQGNIEQVRTSIQDTIDLKYDPIDKQIEFFKFALEFTEEDLDKEERERAEALSFALDEQKRVTDAERQKEEQIGEVYANVAENLSGRNDIDAQEKSNILAQIQNSGDSFEAQRIASERGLLTEVSEQKPFQFVSGTKTQQGGIFDPTSGVFTPFVNQISEGGASVGVPEAVFGTPEYVAGVLEGSAQFGEKSMTDSQLEKIQQAQTALGGLQSLQAMLGSDDSSFANTGRLTGTVRKVVNALGSDAEAGAIAAQIQGLVPTVARGIFGEVGVLTDTDIKNYVQTLPNLTSPEEQNRLVTLIMYDTLARTLENTLTSNALNGKNVSRFVPLYNSVLGTISSEKRKLGVTPLAELSSEEFLDSVPQGPTQTPSQGFVGVSPQDFNTSFNSFINR